MHQHATTSPLQSSYIEGIDISRYQGDIDWNALTPDNTGKQFIISKATEGATYQDPMFVQNFRNASSVGFRPGAYHFLRFGSSSPIDQMKNFVTQIEAARAALPPSIGLDNREPIIALDIEEHKNADYTLVGSVTEASVRYLQNEASVTPYIYTRKNFWDTHVVATPDIVKQCPLWIARWRTNEPLAHELPVGWNSWQIWQYSTEGLVPGIRGPVDLNKMNIS